MPKHATSISVTEKFFKKIKEYADKEDLSFSIALEEYVEYLEKNQKHDYKTCHKNSIHSVQINKRYLLKDLMPEAYKAYEDHIEQGKQEQIVRDIYAIKIPDLNPGQPLSDLFNEILQQTKAIEKNPGHYIFNDIVEWNRFKFFCVKYKLEHTTKQIAIDRWDIILDANVTFPIGNLELSKTT